MDQKLNIRIKMIKLVDESIDINLYDPEFHNGFLNIL